MFCRALRADNWLFVLAIKKEKLLGSTEVINAHEAGSMREVDDLATVEDDDELLVLFLINHPLLDKVHDQLTWTHQCAIIQ